jgi:putative lipoprotein
MNSRRHLAALGAGFCLFLQGCTGPDEAAAPSPPSTARLPGTATWSEPVTLPVDATLEVIIEDVSRADTRAEVIARTLVADARQLPARFSIDYPVERILPGHRYNVRGRIEQQGRLLFISDTHHDLPPAGSTGPFELRLARTDVSAASTAELTNTFWRLLQIGDARVSTPEGQREIHLVLHAPSGGPGRVAGFGGCNGFEGGYTIDGDRISIPQVASTMMACEQGMDTEQAFHAALGKATRWAIRGEQLDLFDADGKRIALFESVYLR